MQRQIVTRTQTATPAYYANRLLSRLGIGCVHRYLFVRQPIAGLPKPIPGFDVRELSAEDRLLSIIEPDMQVRQWRQEQGGRCVVAFRGEDITAHLWYVRRQFDEDEVRARYCLDAASVWDLGLEVRPRYRGGRAFAALWAGTAQIWREQGITMSFSRINDYNRSSLQPHLRMGAEIVGTATFISNGKLQYCASRLRQGGRWSGSGRALPCFYFGDRRP